MCVVVCVFFFFQAEDGIRDLVRSRGLGDVYKRQSLGGRGIRVNGISAGPIKTLAASGIKDFGKLLSLSLIHI